MIFLSLIFDVFKTLLVLKPNLKEVTEAISPFNFVFRFSTVENLITINLGRKTQFYISSTGAYSRVNQSQQDETSWTAWVKLS